MEESFFLRMPSSGLSSIERILRKLPQLGSETIPLGSANGIVVKAPGEPTVYHMGDTDVFGDMALRDCVARYKKAVDKGLLKVMSKMGISTYQSYCGAQIFDAVGLTEEFVEKYFTGTPSNIEGIGVFEVAEEAIRLHTEAFSADPVLANVPRPVRNACYTRVLPTAVADPKLLAGVKAIGA